MDHFAILAFYIELQEAMGIGPEPFGHGSLQGKSLVGIEGRSSVVCK